MLRLADVTVIDDPPAVRLPVSGELDPTTTLPKLRLPGDTANWPAAVNDSQRMTAIADESRQVNFRLQFR